MAHRHAAAHPDPSPDRQHTFVPATTSTIATQINVNDPDDKMGGIDYLRLDKNRDKAYAFDLAFDESISQHRSGAPPSRRRAGCSRRAA